MAPIPRTAPFDEEEIELLNRVVGPATEMQRAWLAGFLAGLDARGGEAEANGNGEAPQLAAAAQSAEPLTILYATESGNSEKLAVDMAKSARKAGLKATLLDMADLDLAALPATRRLVVIAATWGEGEPPARATNNFNDLMSDKAPRLDGVDFAVLALGDTAYAEFCSIGRTLDERLAALGGKRVADRVDLDLDFAAPAAKWIEGALTALAPPAVAGRGQVIGQVIPVDFGARPAAAGGLDIVEAQITEHIDLNSSQSDKETIHIELSFDGAAPPYKPGDSLDIYPENNPDYVREVLRASGLPSYHSVADELQAQRDITTLSVKTIENFVAATSNADAKALLESGNARAWVEGRQFIDLLENFSATLSADQLRSVTRPLAPRAYSIASSRREVGEEAHLLISAARYQTHGRAREGVTSTWVTDRLKKGSKLRVKLRPNKHFALPAPDRDIIMIGPGTGIAPFRAFVQERRAAAATGKNWLFFGDRSFTHDFLYQLEWQDALADGGLTRMDVAFSRDTPAKVYVQHRMWEQRRDLIDWLERGALLYVCGDAKAMAKDVRATLVRAYADVKGLDAEAAELAVRNLDREKRYLQDTY